MITDTYMTNESTSKVHGHWPVKYASPFECLLVSFDTERKVVRHLYNLKHTKDIPLVNEPIGSYQIQHLK